MVPSLIIRVIILLSVQLLSVRMPNAVGRGERISSDFVYGSKNAVGWSLNFIKPLYGHVQLPWAIAAFFLYLHHFFTVTARNVCRVNVKLHLPPHQYSVTALPSKTYTTADSEAKFLTVLIVLRGLNGQNNEAWKRLFGMFWTTLSVSGWPTPPND